MTHADEFSGSPRLFPLQLDLARGVVRFVRLSEADYRAASFLDERLLAGAGESAWQPWSQVEATAAGLASESDFIFHIGHVGSTLLSRLLGAHSGVFALREPAILRPLAVAPANRSIALGPILRLYARVWRSDQRSLVKATSFVAEVAPEIMRLAPSSRSILMFVTPRIYIATLLAGEYSRLELSRVTAARMARLRVHVTGAHVEPRGEGEMAAAGWACEICALARTAAEYPDRCLWLDFDRFLNNRRAGLSVALEHLRGDADPAELDAMLASPDFDRYSKDPEQPFNSRWRSRIIGTALAEHASEIERGLAWLNAAGNTHPAIARASRAAAAGRTI